MPKKETNPGKKPPLANYGRYMGIAFQMIAVLLIGVFGGMKADEYFQTSPILTAILGLLSVVVAMAMVMREFIGKK
ncbi:MAG: AtpZ/AtpI family protein [Chitinophagales bacterium]